MRPLEKRAPTTIDYLLAFARPVLAETNFTFMDAGNVLACLLMLTPMGAYFLRWHSNLEE